MSLHRVYGLTLDTDIAFGPEIGPLDVEPRIDWVIRWNDDPVDLEIEPGGDRIVDTEYWPSFQSGHLITIWSRSHGRIEIDIEARTISVALFERNEQVAALLLRGVVMSLVLELEALPVLHANAVDVAGDAIAFTGPQGAGKTTTTTALCAAGLRLLTDDVVPLERIDGVLGSRSGLTDLRLRPAASHLLELFPADDEPLMSVDGRLVLQLPHHPLAWMPLHSVLVPWPTEDHVGPVRIEPIARGEALAILLGAFRVPSFHDRTLGQSRLVIVSEMMSIPMGRLLMPYRQGWTIDEAVEARRVVEEWHAEVRP